MKRLFSILFALGMLLSLSACAAGEPALSSEEQAFQAACALLEEGKYQEAYAAFTALESYQRIQEKVDEAAAGIEALRRAEEDAAKQTELEQLDFLCGTTWHELGGTTELTFDAYQRGGSRLHCLYRYDWETTDAYDVHWKFIDGEIRVAYFSGLDPDVDPELGHLVIPEERDGVTHLLIGGLDFVRTEDYGPYAPIEVEITPDNWQDYFEILEGPWWQYDDFGVRSDVAYTVVLCLKEEYRDRAILERSSVTFGYTYDVIFKSISQLDFENALLELGDTLRLIIQDQNNTFVTASSHDTYPYNDADFPFPHALGILSQGSYVQSSPDFFDTIDNVIIDRVTGILVLKPE